MHNEIITYKFVRTIVIFLLFFGYAFSSECIQYSGNLRSVREININKKTNNVMFEYDFEFSATSNQMLGGELWCKILDGRILPKDIDMKLPDILNRHSTKTNVDSAIDLSGIKFFCDNTGSVYVFDFPNTDVLVRSFIDIVLPSIFIKIIAEKSNDNLNCANKSSSIQSNSFYPPSYFSVQDEYYKMDYMSDKNKILGFSNIKKNFINSKNEISSVLLKHKLDSVVKNDSSFAMECKYYFEMIIEKSNFYSTRMDSLSLKEIAK